MRRGRLTFLATDSISDDILCQINSTSSDGPRITYVLRDVPPQYSVRILSCLARIPRLSVKSKSSRIARSALITTALVTDTDLSSQLDTRMRTSYCPQSRPVPPKLSEVPPMNESLNFVLIINSLQRAACFPSNQPKRCTSSRPFC
jgi:hypothetical protein